MIRAYYFHEKAADIIKEELKKNFCSLSVEFGRKAVKGGKGYGESEADRDKLNMIITCRNTRDVIGEKGAKIRLLQHKINGFFGFNEGFAQLFVEAKQRQIYDLEDMDKDQMAFGKGRGKDRKGKKGSVPDETEEAEEEVKAKAKPPLHHPVPENFDSEQWKECAQRCAQLVETLKQERTFAPVNMILRDPLRYGLRLWREYNLRAAPIAALASPFEGQDFRDSHLSVGLETWDDWASLPSFADFDWGADPPQDEKKAARAERFGSSKATDLLVLKDFASDEEIQVDNIDMGIIVETNGDTLR